MGFPIRQSPDHSSVANSPGLIAGSYDLLRLLVPRHPPCALSSLSLQRLILVLMLASTMQFSRNGRYQPQGHRVVASATRSVGRWPKEMKPHEGLIPQDPTTCQAPDHQDLRVSTLSELRSTDVVLEDECQIVDVPLVSITASRHSLDQRCLDAGEPAPICSLERR